MNIQVITLQDLLSVLPPYPLWAVIGSVVVAAVLLSVLVPKRGRHWHTIRRADRALKQLERIGREGGAARQFGYLRSAAVSAFCFEEMILTALKRRGLKIRRNKRYTGDGGIDGRFWADGQLILIQAKLYRDHIKPQDVEDFFSCAGASARAGHSCTAARPGRSRGCSAMRTSTS
jgi:hypothetical protein